MIRAFITLIVCGSLCAAAHAQEAAEDWHQYKIDDKVSVSFPAEMPKDMNWVDSSYGVGDSTFKIEARIIDLSEEIASMDRMSEKELTEQVYVTQLKRMANASKFNIDRKLWRWKKHNFVMVAWFPVTNPELQFYGRIRTYPWGRDNTQMLPPVVRYERMLFLNNKLYLFSMTAISVEYHDRNYFMIGGREQKDLMALKEKFFRSIDIQK